MIALGEPHYHRMLEPMRYEQEEEMKAACLNIKLKNELCRNFLETGFCKYHDKCQFAHGIQELRQHHSTNNKYKTKKCISYFERGQCSYGERCNFRHHEDEEDSKSS